MPPKPSAIARREGNKPRVQSDIMLFRRQIFRMAAHALSTARIDGLLGRRYCGIGSIFALHSVVSRRTDYLCDNLRTSAAFLEKLIRHLSAQGVDIVSLDEAVARMEAENPRPFVCFTFDDGYKDNFSVALPIFERYQVPFAIFITTCFIERRINNWWSGLAQVVKQQDRIDAPELGTTLDTSNLQKKIAVYQKLKTAVIKGLISPEGLWAFLTKYKVCLEHLLEKDALDVCELRQLAASPLVEIGGHTTNHPRLALLDSESAHGEMLGNKIWLEAMLDREVRHFAYPFGDTRSCGVREAAIARDVGFQTAATTRIGNIFAAHSEQLHALPRLRLFSDEESLTLIDFQRHGGAGALLTGFGNPVVSF